MYLPIRILYLPGLDHLTTDKLLQHKGGHILIILGLDVCQVTLNGLEGKAEEVCPDLLEAVHWEAGVAPVVKELDVTGTGLLIMRHHLDDKNINKKTTIKRETSPDTETIPRHTVQRRQSLESRAGESEEKLALVIKLLSHIQILPLDS